MTKKLSKKQTDLAKNQSTDINLRSDDGIVSAVRSRGWDFPTMSEAKIQKISERMGEIDRALHTTGRKNTQTTSQLMTLTMLTDSPYRRLRHCFCLLYTSDAADE